MKTKINKRGDFPSFILAIVMVAVTGIILLLLGDITSKIYDGFDEQLQINYNNTEPVNVIQQVSSQNNKIYDFAFLGILIAYVASLMIVSFYTPSNILFMFFYIILIMFGLIVGVIFANMWGEIADNPALTATVSEFPITDFIMGSFFTSFVTIIGATMIIMFFGKNAQGGIG